jgi:hypothetical protein
MVRALSDGIPPASSAIIFNAKPDETIDLVVPLEDPSEYEALDEKVTPLLGKTPLTDLREDAKHQDVSFLAGGTGHDKATLIRFVLAHQLAQKQLPEEFWFALLSGGAFRLDETQDLEAQRQAISSSLALLDAATVRNALTYSLDRGVVGAAFRDQSDAWVKTFLDFGAGRAAGPKKSARKLAKPKEAEERSQEVLPTAAFASGLARSLQSGGRARKNGGPRGLRHAKRFSQFLDSHPDFDLLKTPIDEFLQNGAQPGFLALAGENEDFKQEMKAVQRVFKLAPTFETTDALLADGVHSAQQVYRMGETQFVSAYADRPGFTADSARLAWSRAADTHAAVVTILGDLQALDDGSLPMALRSGRSVDVERAELSASAAPAPFPSWENLFQTGDFCECEHCRSVLSPAAYFTDIVKFLADRPSKVSAKTVKGVLFDRRPDLGFLELSCDNALVPLPYVDVVCEVLEQAIAGGENDVRLAGLTAITSADSALVARKLADNGLPLGAAPRLSQIDTRDPNRWVLHGEEATYLLAKPGTATELFARILPNTKASAEELAAAPQYANPKAYDKLKTAKHPFILPFDLYGEEVRAALRKVNLQRWELMRTLRGGTAPNNPGDVDVAAEYFNISAAGEKALILNEDLTGQQVVWGETGNAQWLDTVANVKNFLRKTGLEYAELLALLDLKLIRPAGIDHQDSSCDLAKKTITPLDAAKLDRMHRFLRLWRKLEGWQMWELDLAIDRLGNGKIDDPFLASLFHFCELRKRLGGQATVEQTLALFGNLNTGTHFTQPHEKRADGLYQQLFLNRRLIRPLDPAFEVAKVDVPGPTSEKISVHLPAMLAALEIPEADLAPFRGLDLTLANLSLVWRHTWLSRSLKLKPSDWKLAQKILSQDVAALANPKAALEYVDKVDRLMATGFSLDELNWLLAADRTARAAVREDEAARFLFGLRQTLQAIESEHANPPTEEAQLSELLTTLLQKLNRDETEVKTFLEILKAGKPVDATTGLKVKFFEPVFTAPLAALPPAVDFQAQLPAGLAARITYETEERRLRCAGILSPAERAALDGLAPASATAYHNAVKSLAEQPAAIAPPDARIWLTNDDLDATKPANDTLVKRVANAVRKALAYLAKTFSERAVIEQCGVQLGLSEPLTRFLLTRFPRLPEPLLQHLTGAFAATSGPVDATTLKSTFDGWYWALRVAAIWKRWKLALADLDPILALTANAQLLDFLTLPLDGARATASAERFVRTSRLLEMRKSLPETGITLLEVLGKLNAGKYAGFGADVERLNDAWRAADVDELVASLNIVDPGGYLLVESWERLRRAFDFLGNLNAGAAAVKRFAAAVMTEAEAKTLRGLLRARFGATAWLALSGEIQNVLRERKRDALTAYRLAQGKPADAPSGKWESANDLYAYHLLDVEMGACQQTSRLVQASGSVQLFVQRCLMGLEPGVLVKADGPDGDSAWRWWKWMSRYRPWEANRKVFLWPENFVRPELRKDKSPFFKDLENELLQNELNPENIEAAFVKYLEKLDRVAQLEIAGFYQEDNGDDTILHVFGRTTGAEPQLYYYRRWDNYSQWMPWEKVDVAVQGDYLVPAVVNGRLFLFFPVFTEVPDAAGNSEVPTPDTSKPKIPLEKTKKKLRLQLAMSEYRQGKWTPERRSKACFESDSFSSEIVRDKYRFWAIDETDINGRFTFQFRGGSSVEGAPALVALLRDGFEIGGSRSAVEKEVHSTPLGNFDFALGPSRAATESDPKFLKWHELASRSGANDLTLEGFPVKKEATDPTPTLRTVQLLNATPGIFKTAPGWHLSYFDRLLLGGQPTGRRAGDNEHLPTRTSTWLPFFYNDEKRIFFVLPTVAVSDRVRLYYPDLKRGTRRDENTLAGTILTAVAAEVDELFKPGNETRRQAMENVLAQEFREEPPPPYSRSQLQSLLFRFRIGPPRRDLGIVHSNSFFNAKFQFKAFYHPFVSDFLRIVENPLRGIPGLMSRATQLSDTGFQFDLTYRPTDKVMRTTGDPNRPNDLYPVEDVDFSPDGAYSSYNWETFLMTPQLIADSLSRDQRFAEARDWYHYIFNPLGEEPPPAATGSDVSPMRRYWITKPFFATTDPDYRRQRIEEILRMLAGGGSVPPELQQQVLAWRRNPYEPHRIASYRTVAYQKAVLMGYLDNLIAWADSLFQQDTMESINEATQLYVLAAELLGPRPKRVPPRVKAPVETFNELEPRLDAFSEAMVQVENLIPASPGGTTPGADAAPLPTLYFSIPQNDKLLGYWDKVEDRLYKIRHCMNLEGVARQLDLFAPPIPPEALVKAVAAGVDVGAALADLNVPLPLYRFNVLLQKANEVCNDVKALGSALLAALEKKDAETLGLLRQSHEMRLLESVKAVRETQIAEARENLEGVRRSKAVVETRRDYYRNIQRLITQERLHLDKMSESHTFQEAAQGLKLSASIISILPAIDLGASGFGGTPLAKFKIGGLELGQAAGLAADVLSFLSQIAASDAAMASSKAGFDRRWADWKLQESIAEKELVQLDRQIAAAELRLAVAEKELQNHLLQIESSKATDAFLRSKHTREDLYQWQVGQISGVYFQSYKLAYDLAKRAERCLRFELGLQDSSYIRPGHWDSLKKGLLAGEKLQHDLRRLETGYLEKNRREFELTKHVSLARLDPLALVKLRETGRCFFRLPEETFDLDYPGHYFRRIKSVSLTLPCVVGPYTTISCTLRLLKSSLRINIANGNNGYPHNTDAQGLPADDPRFAETNIPVQAIAASNGQNDSGMFELSFRDERYLPFEGAGAVSEWLLELVNDPAAGDFGKSLRQWDYNTLSDAVLHVKYTAREDAGAFKNAAAAHLRSHFQEDGALPSIRLLDLRKELPGAWSRFLNPADPAAGNVFELPMEPRLFSLPDHDKTLKITTVWLLARCTDQGTYTATLEVPPAGPKEMKLAPEARYGGLHAKETTGLAITVKPAGPPVLPWKLKMTRPDGKNLKPQEVTDVFLVLGYDWEPPLP